MARSWELGLGMKLQAEIQNETISLLLRADQETWIGLGFIDGDELSMIGPTGADAFICSHGIVQRYRMTTYTEPQNGVPVVEASCSHISGSRCI